MTRSQLIKVLAEEYKDFLPSEDLETVVDVVTVALSDALVSNRGAEIRGFGSFRNRKLGPRLGRNPKSGRAIELGDRLIPTFKAGQDLREQLADLGIS